MKNKKTLGPDEIVIARRIGRRGALGVIAAGSAFAAVLGPSRVEARSSESSKASDSDPNDPAGRGRTGFTDRDSGPGADGAGRGVCAERGWSDSDPSDERGRGRGPCH